jgi:hypothetical protein
MTEPSSELLAQALEDAGYLDLAARARRDEFHDFATPHVMPQHVLVYELRARGKRARELLQRVATGEFDATLAESEAWIASPEGQAALAALPPEARRIVGGRD